MNPDGAALYRWNKLKMRFPTRSLSGHRLPNKAGLAGQRPIRRPQKEKINFWILRNLK